MDEAIKKGVVASDERGQLFVVLGQRTSLQDRQTTHRWFGFGFNGDVVHRTQADFVAPNINTYIAALLEDKNENMFIDAGCCSPAHCDGNCGQLCGCHGTDEVG